MTSEPKQTSGISITSLVLALLGLSIPAIICGHIGRSQIKKNSETLAGEGLALAGLIIGYIQIGLFTLMIPLMAAIAIPSFVQAKEFSQQALCVNNMRMIDVVKDQAALEHNLTAGESVSEDLLSESLQVPVSSMLCPKGGVYSINPVGVEPTCTEHGAISEPQPLMGQSMPRPLNL
jgi:hypothetical protein